MTRAVSVGLLLALMLALPLPPAIAQVDEPTFVWPWLDDTHTWTSGPHGWDARCGQRYEEDDLRSRCIGTDIPAIDRRSALDFGGEGWLVHPMAPGHVIYAGRLPGTLGYGVVVDHGSYQTAYAHMGEAGLRERLGEVTRLEVLGKTACTGPCGTGPHLHVDLRRGAARNKDGTLDFGEPVPWHGRSIAGWTITAGSRNYDGTATRGEEHKTAEANGSESFTSGGAGPATTLTVPSTVEWSDTGIDLQNGEFVEIEATGVITVGGYDFHRGITPDGCIGHLGFPCSMLIGRLDGGEPFAVGSDFEAYVEGGRLELGIAEKALDDNEGSWQVDVYVDPGDATALAVDARKSWSDTGLTIPANARLGIDATGRVQVHPHTLLRSPDGCAEETNTAGVSFPAPGEQCWSLIGRIGVQGQPFAVGSSWIGVATEGRLYLGVNDTDLGDNTGSWQVVIEH